jgi:hypothetical protein
LVGQYSVGETGTLDRRQVHPPGAACLRRYERTASAAKTKRNTTPSCRNTSRRRASSAERPDRIAAVAVPCTLCANASFQFSGNFLRGQRFDDFTLDNDAYGERDCGACDYVGGRIFGKIDDYDRTLRAGSEDPSNPRQTVRVLTIMLASD